MTLLARVLDDGVVLWVREELTVCRLFVFGVGLAVMACVASVVVVAPLACAGLVKADGDLLAMDPGTPFSLYTQNTNDAYNGFRGMVFTADVAAAYNGAALWTKSAGGLNATFNLYEINTTVGDVLQGANLVRSVSGVIGGDLGFHGLKFADITLTANQSV